MSILGSTKISIKRFRGDTKTLKFRLTQNDEAFDLGGKTFTLNVAESTKKGTGEYIFQIVGSPIGLSSLGILGFEFTEDESDFIGSYEYDVEMVDEENKISTPIYGTLSFVQDV